MIICHTHQFLYIGPPKTASTTMHRWLTQKALFDPYVDEDWRDSGEQHAHVIPEGCKYYYSFATIRDEEDRIRSLWRHSRSEAERGEGTPLLTYAEFLDWRQTCGKRFFAAGIDEYLTERIDRFLQFEHLDKEIQELPFFSSYLEPLPQINRNPRNPKQREEELLRLYGA